MTDLIIACLSQKGGVGKSTMARLIARTYAAGGWDVKIADFNLNQLTSCDWTATRLAQGVDPEVRAEPYNSAKRFRNETVDLIVADGKPDSDQSSLEIAKAATLCVIPTGLSVDDLRPQVAFANELINKGVPRDRILIVLNKVVDSQIACDEAREYLRIAGYQVAETDLAAKTTYQNAQNSGRAISECNYKPLADRADSLGAEIVAIVNKLEKLAA